VAINVIGGQIDKGIPKDFIHPDVSRYRNNRDGGMNGIYRHIPYLLPTNILLNQSYGI